MTDDRYLDVYEAAEYLGCSAHWIRRMVRRGLLRHVRVGTRIRTRREWLDQAVAAAAEQRSRTPGDAADDR